MMMKQREDERGHTLTTEDGRIYVECRACHDGAGGANNRHGAATIQAFTAGHTCLEETDQ